MTTRHISDLLPIINQTDTIKSFLGASADHLFEPGSAEPISGYIGIKPTYYNSAKDFYVAEPSTLRQTHQLEPTMLSIDSTNTMTQALFYDDLIDYLNANGGVTTNQTRLFENEYYSWAPPLDLDKWLNPHQYVWFPDRINMPTIDLMAPIATYTSDGITTSYAMPAVINGIVSSMETPLVFVTPPNSPTISVSFTVVSGNVILTSPPVSGSKIEVMRYSDLSVLINGQASFSLTNWTLYGWIPNPSQSFTRMPITSLTALSNGMQIRLVDATVLYRGFEQRDYDVSENPWDLNINNIFTVIGVGTSINLQPVGEVIPDVWRAAQYVTIGRGALDGNPWSMHNHWIYKNNLSWSGIDYTSRQGARPILEFVPGIKLFNYGTTRLATIQAVLTGSALYNNSPISMANINGKPLGSIVVDNGHVLRENDRLLVAQTTPDQIALNNLIYTVGKSRITNTTGQPTDVITLVVDGSPSYGDIVQLDTVVSVDPVEYYYNGSKWTLAAEPPQYPLFDLFDNDGVSLSDSGRYPGSNFAGSQIFFYASGTGTNDAILAMPLSYDTYGQIIYNNALVSESYTYNSGTIPQYYYYAINDATGLSYHTDWHLSDMVTIQSQDVNGIYELPKNLHANADYQTVTSISKYQFFDHISNLMTQQSNFVGLPFNINNWHDLPIDLSLGNVIIQNRTPLLKTMLLCSDSRFDIPDAIRYADAEYTRFKIKFLRKIVEFHNKGTMSSSATPDEWVVAILENMRFNKTSDQPFAYNNFGGGQYFIPPTPTMLGILPAYQPGFETDTSYSSPVTMMRGHDGSMMATFGDLRDNVLLALENRIYNNLPSSFQTDARPVFDIKKYMEGKFFPVISLEYSRTEVESILSPMFELWCQKNGLDYRTNNNYDPNNPFTWNYSTSLDADGQSVPGNWRGIYRWYFDTDRPHSNPWEMLGFGTKPSWWDQEYGSAPYTRGNTKLWNDLELGNIAQGVRAGIDLRYARPGLSYIIPVDDSGKLLDPMAAKIIPLRPHAQVASKPWSAGDISPIENLWMTSPSYPYALALASFLMKPARFVEECWDSVNNSFVHNEQWINTTTNIRSPLSEVWVHGELNGSTRVTNIGNQQWVSDLMRSRGQDVSILGSAIRNTTCKLAHKMAGFTTNDNLKVLADNFGLVPSENITIDYYTNPNVRQEIYSGVIIEWIGYGWKVIGYDSRNPNFTIFPPNVNSSRGILSLSDVQEPVINTWRPNIYYKAGVYIEYNYSYYACATSHTSGSTFEQQYWTATPGLVPPQAPRVITYTMWEQTSVNVPYGTVFTTFQDISDFLLGYEQWLLSRGWQFDETGAKTGVIKNWSLAVLEFLGWAQVNWSEGNFIALSPAADKLVYTNTNGMVLDVERNVNGVYGLLDRNGVPIKRADSVVNRLDNITTIYVVNNNLFCARLSIAEVEHILVFDNTTIFNDIMYEPLFDLWQPRLKMSGLRTTNWSGRLETPGYVLSNGNIIPNFDRGVEDLRYMFDIEKSYNKTLRDRARALVGYQPMSYLNDLLISDTQQFEFYQGMIQQKGAPDVFNKLTRSQFIDQGVDLNFFEEWAIRVGNYGALNNFSRISFMLYQTDMKRDGLIIRVSDIPNNPNDTRLDLPLDSNRWIVAPTTQSIIPTRTTPLSSALPTAGYVRITEVDYTIFNYTDLTTLYTSSGGFTVGNKIWCYVNEDDTSWTVFRVFNASVDGSTNLVSNIVSASTGVGTLLYMTNPHGLTSADIGSTLIINGQALTQNEIEGVNVITGFDTTNNWIEINAGITAGYDWATSTTPSNAPSVQIIRPMRFANVAAIPSLPYLDTDFVYIDADAQNRWEVLSWNGSWNIARQQPDYVASEKLNLSLIYDLNTKITSTSLSPEPLLVNDLMVIDPACGYMPGAAMREISYLTNYDPAEYNSTDESILWGSEQVGKLWWNLSTVRFYNTQTDIPTLQDDTRTMNELSYRSLYWGKLAPNSAVLVYEWVRSTSLPTNWSLDGTAFTGNYVTRQEFDPVLNMMVSVYYYWVNGRKIIPGGTNRHMSALAVANLIQYPTSSDIPWIAPISENAVMVGNITQYLNDSSTVLQIDTTVLDYDGIPHDEWVLLRPNDQFSLPPDQIWKKIRDSLAGFNDNKNTVPDPTLHSSFQIGVGVRPLQSLFAPSDMVAARTSMVDSINIILESNNLVLERPLLIEALTATNTPLQHLIWMANGRNAQPLPPSIEWNNRRVTSPLDRDRILITPDFLNAFEAAHNNQTIEWPRVLLDLRDDTNTPQWSVWEFDPSGVSNLPILTTQQAINAYLLANPDRFLRLARTYDYDVNSFAARDALTATIGTRVLVNGNTSTSGFWTVWKYDGSQWSLVNWQTNNINDCWNYVDWYSTGYSATNPPVVTFANVNARDAVQPITVTFVNILDDGYGKWMWTYYDGSTWNVVAREKGTISLNSNLTSYNSYTIYDKQSIDYTQIGSRDTGWELRNILDILRDNLEGLEINTIFFSFLHFLHTKQDQIGWAFKTSFLTVAGFNQPLIQNPVALPNNTNDLLAYIEEVKPYHVMTRSFVASYTPSIDIANTHVSDFDKPIYYDTKLGTYRVLDPTLSGDLAIIQSTEPWKTWWNAQGQNLERRFNIQVKFDRVSNIPINTNWDQNPFDLYAIEMPSVNTNFDYSMLDALQRTAIFYSPLPSMLDNDVSSIFGLGPKIDTIDGSTQSILSWSGRDVVVDGNASSTDAIINPTVNGQSSYGLRDPFAAAGRPEELVMLSIEDTASITVTSLWNPGAHIHTVKSFPIDGFNAGVNATVSLPEVAQSNNAIAVFQNGLRAIENKHFTIDNANNTVSVNLTRNNTAVCDVAVHTFSIANLSAIRGNLIVQADGINDVFTPGVSLSNATVDVFVNGVINNSYQIVGNTVVIPNLNNGDIVSIVVNELASSFGADSFDTNPWETATSNLSTTSQVYTQIITYDGSTTSWTLTNPTTSVQPEYAGTIVELNGYRLMPPETHYQFVDSNHDLILLDQSPIASNVRLLVGGQPYGLTIATLVDDFGNTGSTPTGVDDFGLVSDIVSEEDWGSIHDLPAGVQEQIANLPKPIPGQGQFALYQNILIQTDPMFQGNVVVSVIGENDYDVINGVLTISATIKKNDLISVTTFSDAAKMGIRTHTFNGNITGGYSVSSLPFDSDHSWVNVNGLKMVNGQDYNIVNKTLAFDEIPFDNQQFDIANNNPTLVLNNTSSPSTKIVATIFSGSAVVKPTKWKAATSQLSSVRLQPISEVYAQSSRGNRQLYVNVGWDFTTLHNGQNGYLAQPLNPGDTEIVINLDTSLPSFIQDPQPFALPDTINPGVIWINGERIEFFGRNVNGNVITLSQLRRSTRATRTMFEQRLIKTFQGNNSQTEFTMVDVAGLILEVRTITNGKIAYPSINIDYIIENIGSITAIIFNNAPSNLTKIIVATTTSIAYPIGTICYNGNNPLSYPPNINKQMPVLV